MQVTTRAPSFTFARCARACLPHKALHPSSELRSYSSAKSPPSPSDLQDGEINDKGKEEGAMSRRLAEMTAESIETGGRSARKAVAEAGFGDDLRKQLEDRIASASFRSENASALAQVNLPASASKQTREIAGAKAWTGEESIVDASFRMLNDAHKPMRAPSRTPGIRTPTRVDTGRPKEGPGTGARLANARDRSSVYAVLKDKSMTEQEREKYREELKARFQPASRAVPATIQGLQSLANERIEDAIARGQFKNIPRGKEIERDYNASNPFINTTEYFLNKMIQRQDILPPWVEKQQELVSTTNRFRARLRADWKRHVARTISSRGGPLEAQLKLAEEYAWAERIANPSKRKVEAMNTVDDQGHLSQITISGDLQAKPTISTDAVQNAIHVVEQNVQEDGSLGTPRSEMLISTESPPPAQPSPAQSPPQSPTVPPFRDPRWEEIEGAYLRAAIKNLNDLTRSYNLMAPDLAKKTYFSLDRELKSCYADVAPEVAGMIRERALRPRIKGVEVIGHTPGSMLEKFSMDTAVNVYDERKPQYGFKEFWRDLFARKE